MDAQPRGAEGTAVSGTAGYAEVRRNRKRWRPASACSGGFYRAPVPDRQYRRGVNGRGETGQLDRQRRRERATARRPARLAAVAQETEAPRLHGWRERGRTQLPLSRMGLTPTFTPTAYTDTMQPSLFSATTPAPHVGLQRRVIPPDDLYLCPAGHGQMVERDASDLTADQRWLGRWWACTDPGCGCYGQEPSAALREMWAEMRSQRAA